MHQRLYLSFTYTRADAMIKRSAMYLSLIVMMIVMLMLALGTDARVPSG